MVGEFSTMTLQLLRATLASKTTGASKKDFSKACVTRTNLKHYDRRLTGLSIKSPFLRGFLFSFKIPDKSCQNADSSLGTQKPAQSHAKGIRDQQ